MKTSEANIKGFMQQSSMNQNFFYIDVDGHYRFNKGNFKGELIKSYLDGDDKEDQLKDLFMDLYTDERTTYTTKLVIKEIIKFYKIKK